MARTKYPNEAPPLHRLFDEKEALRAIRDRYASVRTFIPEQIEALQTSSEFRALCKPFYDREYPDWILLGAIFNFMMNLRAQDLNIDMFSSPEAAQKGIKSAREACRGFKYDARRFLDAQVWRIHVYQFNDICLLSYGFEPRRKDFNPEGTEKFLRERMRHFDLDYPHDRMFGEPPGNWPEL